MIQAITTTPQKRILTTQEFLKLFEQLKVLKILSDSIKNIFFNYNKNDKKEQIDEFFDQEVCESQYFIHKYLNVLFFNKTPPSCFGDVKGFNLMINNTQKARTTTFQEIISNCFDLFKLNLPHNLNTHALEIPFDYYSISVYKCYYKTQLKLFKDSLTCLYKQQIQEHQNVKKRSIVRKTLNLLKYVNDEKGAVESLISIPFVLKKKNFFHSSEVSLFEKIIHYENIFF